jgi:hypothetical protein
MEGIGGLMFLGDDDGMLSHPTTLANALEHTYFMVVRVFAFLDLSHPQVAWVGSNAWNAGFG